MLRIDTWHNGNDLYNARPPWRCGISGLFVEAAIMGSKVVVGGDQWEMWEGEVYVPPKRSKPVHHAGGA